MENKRLIISVGSPATGGAVDSVNGKTGDVVLYGTDIETEDGSGVTVKEDLDSKENSITAGTTTEYFRGDKTFQTLDKNAVGLGNVDNTSDADKPISTATQAALDNKLESIPNASYNVVGGIKISRDSATSTTYISFDGSDVPNVT